MNTLRTLKKLVLGETWLLPLGVAVIVGGSALLIRPLVGAEWHHVGGLIILAVAMTDELLHVLFGGAPRYEKPPAETAEEVIERAMQSGA